MIEPTYTLEEARAELQRRAWEEEAQATRERCARSHHAPANVQQGDGVPTTWTCECGAATWLWEGDDG